MATFNPRAKKLVDLTFHTGAQISAPEGVLDGNAKEARVFRDMVAAIRDRVAEAIRDGMSLEEIQNAGLTADYDERWAGSGRIGGAASLLAAAYADLAQ